MKNYRYEMVDCDAHDVGRLMNKLQSEGWKQLMFQTGGDFNSDSIQGYRPLTKKEKNEIVRFVKAEEKAELKELRKLAKKHKYKLVKNKLD